MQVFVILSNPLSKLHSISAMQFHRLTFSFLWHKFLTTALFVRVVQAVIQSVAAQLFGDADVVSTGPVRLQTALSSCTVLLIKAGGTLVSPVTASRRVKTADRVNTRKLTRRAFRRAWECWREENMKSYIESQRIKRVYISLFLSFYLYLWSYCPQNKFYLL